MKTTISNIGKLSKASKGKLYAYSTAKQNLEKAYMFHKYISERLSGDYLSGFRNDVEYTATRLVWDNSSITLKEIK